MGYLPYFFLIVMSLFTGMAQVLMKKWRDPIAARLENRDYFGLMIDFRLISIVLLVVTASLLYLLSLNDLDLSIAFSFTGLNYLSALVFSKLVLREKVNWKNFAGVFLIVIGIILFNS
jgi:drug/metabolite transporter (DMT)-like permease